MADPLEGLFNSAASHVQDESISENGKKLDQTQLLQLYGLYKSATIGPCNEPKPGIFNPKGRAKWDAWKRVSSLSKEDAQEGYIEKVKEFYNWAPNVSGDNKSDGSSMGGSVFGGNAVSTFAKESEEEQIANDQKNDPVFAWAKDNEIEKIRVWIEEGNDINLKDEEGQSILHWAVDRGHLDTCKLLLEYGADPLVQDEDGQTPLDYAVTCEHNELVSILGQHAKKSKGSSIH